MSLLFFLYFRIFKTTHKGILPPNWMASFLQAIVCLYCPEQIKQNQ